MSKVEEYLSQIIKKEKAKEEKCNMILCVVGVLLFIAAVAGIAYAVYRFMKPDYLEDYEDDIEDEFDYDDDFFDEEDDFEEVVEDTVEADTDETVK